MSTIQQSFDISNATEIILEGWGEVQIEQGEQDIMVIETEEDLLPKLKTSVKGNRLELGLKNPLDWLFMFPLFHPTVRYTITVQRLERVQISGSGVVTCPQAHSDNLRLGVSGSGKIRFGAIQASSLEVSIPGSGEVAVEETEAQRMTISIPGSGKISAAGTVPQVEAKIGGSGAFKGESLQSENAGVRISGSGEVDLGVSRALEVHISGSGRMRYRGTPSVQTHISGSGSVKPLAA